MLQKIYFSPTGGTKKVVDLLAEAWDGDVRDLDCSLPDGDYAQTFGQDDICIVGVPSYGGRVPAVALTHLAQLRGTNTPAVVVVAYGNRDYDDTLLELRDSLSQNGFSVLAAVAAVTQHSILPQFGTGRPNEADQALLRGYGVAIRQALEHGGASEVAVPGNAPYRDYGGLPLHPKASHGCTKCGACVPLCPVHAIPSDNPGTTDKARCITCMRCVSVCPQHARRLNPLLRFVAGKKMAKGCTAPKENKLFLGDVK
ncbi:MAG: 4Fe-4S binding protein [Oscillospiraceae bacterium]